MAKRYRHRGRELNTALQKSYGGRHPQRERLASSLIPGALNVVQYATGTSLNKLPTLI